jgi:hypothetical protein
MLELPDVAAELYGLVPAEFTAARTARSKEARSSGDADLAKIIGGLSKPSTSAAIVNLLMRERSDELEQLFGLGSELRAAQEDLDRRELQRLGRARQELVAAIARKGTALAENHGMKVSASAIGEVEQTLQAALADPEAEAAVRTGFLTHPLASTGLEPVDLTDAVAIPLAVGETRKLTARKAARPGNAAKDAKGDARRVTVEGDDSAAVRGRAAREKAAAERRAEAQRAADEAAQRSEEAEARLTDLDERIDALTPRRNQLEIELTDLEKKAAEVRAGIAALEREADRLERDRASAADRADTALARDRRARDRLHSLE